MLNRQNTAEHVLFVLLFCHPSCWLAKQVHDEAVPTCAYATSSGRARGCTSATRGTTVLACVRVPVALFGRTAYCSYVDGHMQCTGFRFSECSAPSARLRACPMATYGCSPSNGNHMAMLTHDHCMPASHQSEPGSGSAEDSMRSAARTMLPYSTDVSYDKHLTVARL